MEECVGAGNDKREHDFEIFEFSDEKKIYIPEKYASYRFWFTGELVNGGEKVYVSVNNEPINDVDLSYPQGNRWFYEDIYLVKRFFADIKIKSGRNTIVIKSGNRMEKFIVFLKDPPEEDEDNVEQIQEEMHKMLEEIMEKPIPYIE